MSDTAGLPSLAETARRRLLPGSGANASANAVLPPPGSSINVSGSGSAVANGLLVGDSAGEPVEVYASQAVHVIVDFAGSLG